LCRSSPGLANQLDPGNQVFLVGTTNHIDNIDPRVLRGGRFTEKIEIGVPDDQGYWLLIDRYLGPIPLAAPLTHGVILGRIRGISPADLQAVVSTAKRMAMNRMKDGEATLPPLIWEDFEQSLRRNHVHL
jgi:transitional endoplasmic reticulum ATPase